MPVDEIYWASKRYIVLPLGLICPGTTTATLCFDLSLGDPGSASHTHTLSPSGACTPVATYEKPQTGCKALRYHDVPCATRSVFAKSSRIQPHTVTRPVAPTGSPFPTTYHSNHPGADHALIPRRHAPPTVHAKARLLCGLKGCVNPMSARARGRHAASAHCAHSSRNVARPHALAILRHDPVRLSHMTAPARLETASST
ncbi:hypothetical protein B0H10DRAFT_641128 [Mycena sp. CBHHK59/15]|nr:hypothetical protein B0H10DRAFT_641128 [Mycena sp. CBHHK59/15]